MTQNPAPFAARVARTLAWPAAVVACYTLLSLWLLWPLPLRAGSVLLHQGDPVHQLWTLRWTQHALFGDPARLFAANVNYPYDAALALNQPTYTNALLTAPVYALTHNPALTLNFGVIASFVLSGAFAALLAQKLTGSRWAGLAAGVIYAFAPNRQAHIYHLNLLSGYWTPLALWGLHELWSRERRAPPAEPAEPRPSARGSALVALLTGLAISAQILADFYHAIYLALALALAGLWLIVTRRWGLTRRGALLLIGAGALGALLALPLLLPTARAWAALDLRRPASDHDAYGAALASYLATDQPLPLHDTLRRIAGRATSFRSSELSLYPGAGALLLAALGVFCARRRGLRDAPLYLLIALAAFYLSLGATVRLVADQDGVASPLYRWLYDHMPGFQGARIPARWEFLVQLGLAVLAGYTVALLTSLRGPRWGRALVGLALLGALLLDFRGRPGGGAVPIADLQMPPRIAAALADQPPGAVLHYPLVNANQNLPYLYEYMSMADWRPIVNSGSSIVPPAYIDLRDALAPFPGPQAVALLQALRVRYVVVHRNQMSGWENWWARARAAPGVRVLAQDAKTQDALLAIAPGSAPGSLAAERWTGADGVPQVALLTAAPRVLDRARIYERYALLRVGLEFAGGRVVTTTATLPTYMLRSVSVAWPGLPDGVVALHLPGPGSGVRVALREDAVPQQRAPAPQITGSPLPATARAGEWLPCMLYGRGPIPIPGVVLSLAVWDSAGGLRAKQDRFFDEGFAPPERWSPDRPEPDPCDIALPDDLPPGRYTFSISLYDPQGARFIPFADPTGQVRQDWTRPFEVVTASSH